MTTKKEPFKSKGKERYVMLRYWLLSSAAWKCLPGGARALYLEIAQRYNGSNNGRIPYSVREAVQSLDISHHTGSHWLRILQDRGFIVCTKRGAFSLKTTKDASEWLLTEYASDHPPAHATKDFMRWQPPEGVDIDTLNRRPSHHRPPQVAEPRAQSPATRVVDQPVNVSDPAPSVRCDGCARRLRPLAPTPNIAQSPVGRPPTAGALRIALRIKKHGGPHRTVRRPPPNRTEAPTEPWKRKT